MGKKEELNAGLSMKTIPKAEKGNLPAPNAALNNGIKMPMLGLGVYQSSPGKETRNAILLALEAGYRHIDTAKIYENETDVGEAVRQSGMPRGKSS